MKKIEIYTKDYCTFCHRAKHLLIDKGVAFVEYEISEDSAKAVQMQQRARRRTVPQIFIDDQHIGGCDDLYALENSGKLDPILLDS
ncbi:MAG: glutaredoxin 3 [Desulfuromonas sp.]|nr:MAG: glutaredoxin 3 [Desulfuromonas sp.]